MKLFTDHPRFAFVLSLLKEGATTKGICSLLKAKINKWTITQISCKDLWWSGKEKKSKLVNSQTKERSLYNWCVYTEFPDTFRDMEWHQFALTSFGKGLLTNWEMSYWRTKEFGGIVPMLCRNWWAIRGVEDMEERIKARAFIASLQPVLPSEVSLTWTPEKPFK